MSVHARSPVRGARFVGDRFFRQIVDSMRNGVLAITRDGRVAVMNEVAYRVFDLTPSPKDVGRPFGEVLHSQPDVARILASAFELHLLPNRAELRLKGSRAVMGYTLSHILDDAGQVAGAALFFKDLTRVEELEERERLRDRLAALGEMAAAIAHELKNPLAGIEINAGLLRRRVPDSADLQSLVGDIISEAKLANAIVLEVLEFVRPIRLEVERTSIAQVLHDAVRMAEGKVSWRDVQVTMSVEATCRSSRATITSCASSSPTCWSTPSRRWTARGGSRSSRPPGRPPTITRAPPTHGRSRP